MGKWLMTGMIACMLTVLVVPYVHAESDKGDSGGEEVNKEIPVTYKKVVYGSTLTKEQRDKTAKTLGVKEKEGIVFNEMDLQMDDVKGYLGTDMGDTKFYTSVLVEENEKDKGVRVRIKTPKTVVGVTKTQLMNALLTAGVKDVKVEVASVEEVKGVSSILGIYKGYMAKGNDLEQTRMALGYNELSLLVRIVEENKDTKGFKKEKLSRLLIDMKSGLLDKSKMGMPISEKEIGDVYKSGVATHKLEDVLTEQQVTDIKKHMSDYVNVGVMKDSDIDKQMIGLKKESKIGIIKGIGFVKDVIKERADGVDIKGELKIFFEDLFDAIQNLWVDIKSKFSNDGEKDKEDLDITEIEVEK